MRPPPRDKYYGLGASALRSLGRLALGVGLVRVGGGEVYGVFALLLALEVVAITLATCLSMAPLMTLAPQTPLEQRGALFHFAAERHRRGLLILTLLGVALYPLVRGWGVTPFGCLTFALAAYSNCYGLLFRGWQRASFRSERVLGAELFATGGPLLGLGAALLGAADPLEATLAGYAIGGLAAWALLRLGLPARGLPLAPERAQELRRMGGEMLKGSLAYSLCSRGQPFVLGALGGPVVVALFAGALALTGPLRMFSAAVDGILRPRLALAAGQAPALGLGERFRRTLGLALGLQLGAALVGALGFWLLGERVVSLLYQGELPGLAGLLSLALGYVAVEAVGSTLVVAAQTRFAAEGAALATRCRVLCSLVSLVLLWPACVAGAGGALLALLACEGLFVFLLGAGILRAAHPASLGETHEAPLRPART